MPVAVGNDSLGHAKISSLVLSGTCVCVPHMWSDRCVFLESIAVWYLEERGDCSRERQVLYLG